MPRGFTAYALAGPNFPSLLKHAGGSARVSVFGSALFGMHSGSSVANAVTVGSLTIPAMIRVGYRREFAGAVEAAASTGGQITPPVLGAAAFLKVEFLNIPYQNIIAAAAVPAFLHFLLHDKMSYAAFCHWSVESAALTNQWRLGQAKFQNKPPGA